MSNETVTQSAPRRRATVVLSSYNTGFDEEDDFDRWTVYVAEHIDERTGLDVTVEQTRFRNPGQFADKIDAATPEDEETIREALRALWDSSAWGETHPLRVAATMIAGELGAAQRDLAALEDDETIDEHDPRIAAAEERESLAEEWYEAVHDAMHGSDCPRAWNLSEAGYCYDEGYMASSLEEALEVAKGNVDASNYPDDEDAPRGTMWISVEVECPETGESARETVTLDPEEPECSEEEHDWQAPIQLVGGIKENPGVWGHGGGVYINEVCLHCGCKKLTDTWAQNPETGEQGLRSVRYEPGAFTAEEIEAVR